MSRSPPKGSTIARRSATGRRSGAGHVTGRLSRDLVFETVASSLGVLDAIYGHNQAAMGLADGNLAVIVVALPDTRLA